MPGTELEENGKQDVELAGQRHAKILEDIQLLRDRWPRTNDESASSQERNEVSVKTKDIKTRIKADISWLAMKRTEYKQ